MFYVRGSKGGGLRDVNTCEKCVHRKPCAHRGYPGRALISILRCTAVALIGRGGAESRSKLKIATASHRTANTGGFRLHKSLCTHTIKTESVIHLHGVSAELIKQSDTGPLGQ